MKFTVCFQVQKLSRNEVLMVNIGSLSTGGRVSAVKADLAKIALTQPVCTEVGEKIALSRRVEKHWRWVRMYDSPRNIISPSFKSLTDTPSAQSGRFKSGGC